MPRVHGKDAALFVDEFDFSAVLMNLRVSIERSNGEVTAFADGDATFVGGKAGWKIGANGLWSAASPNYDGEMFTDLTALQRLVGVWPVGAAATSRGFEGRSNISASPRKSDVGGPITLDVEWRGTDPLVRAHSLYKNTALVASGNGNGIQVGAVSAAQVGVGVLRVLSSAGDGTQTLDAVIASAAADAWPGTTRITFTQATTAATFQRSTVAGALTDTWWRSQITIAGGGVGVSFSVLVAFGIITA